MQLVDFMISQIKNPLHAHVMLIEVTIVLDEKPNHIFWQGWEWLVKTIRTVSNTINANIIFFQVTIFVLSNGKKFLPWTANSDFFIKQLQNYTRMCIFNLRLRLYPRLHTHNFLGSKSVL